MLANPANYGGISGWNTVTMDNGTTGYWMKAIDSENTSNISISGQNINTDSEANIVPDGTKIDILTE